MGKRKAKEAPEDLDCIAAHKAAIRKIKQKHAPRVAKLASQIVAAAEALMKIEREFADEIADNPAYIDAYWSDRASFDVYGPMSEQHEFGEIQGPGFADILEAAGVLHYRVTSEAYGSLCGKKAAAKG
jgi:hypothetical protein